MYRITVPASSANLGPGFDCMGVALTLYNTVTLAPSLALSIRVTGESATRIARNQRNLVYATYARTMERWGLEPQPIRLVQENRVPSTRGLGSSSTAIVAGILSAYAMAGREVDREEALSLATLAEGHPDNVAPAILGGFTVSFFDGANTYSIRQDVPSEVVFVALVPDFELSTRKAREVLPKEVSQADAVFNLSRGAYLSAAMMAGDVKKAAAAMEDRLHQNQRSVLIPGYGIIADAARSAGAMAVYLSGAGPTMMALVEGDRVKGFTIQMRSALEQLSNHWRILPLSVCNGGARLERI